MLNSRRALKKIIIYHLEDICSSKQEKKTKKKRGTIHRTCICMSTCIYTSLMVEEKRRESNNAWRCSERDMPYSSTKQSMHYLLSSSVTCEPRNWSEICFWWVNLFFKHLLAMKTCIMSVTPDVKLHKEINAETENVSAVLATLRAE